MLNLISLIDNFIRVPSPALDDSPQGYHLEERLQVTAKSVADEKSYLVEFRLDDASNAPTEANLVAWMESGDPVQIVCSGMRVSPFVQKKDKTYLRQGREIEVNGEAARLDSMVVFAGLFITALDDAPPLGDLVKQARATYKRQRRTYQAQRNAERVAEMEAQMADRVRQLQERKAAQEAAKAPKVVPVGATATPGGPVGRDASLDEDAPAPNGKTRR